MKQKKSLIIMLLVLIGMFFSKQTININAHPGRTDVNGCHYCRTNCNKYGLSNGQYHCHNGGGSSNSDSSSNSNQGNSSNGPTQSQKNEEERQQKIAEQQAAYKRQQEELGEKEGYNYKIENPDSELPDLNGKSEFYIEKYKLSFEKANEELETVTKQQADEKAKKDSKTLDEMDLVVPEGVKQVLYMDIYKEKFTFYEQEWKKNIKEIAYTDADFDAFNKIEQKKDAFYDSKKGSELYIKFYSEKFTKNRQMIEKLFTKIKDEGFEAGKKYSKKKNDSYVKYKNYKIYDDLNQTYEKAYKLGKKENRPKNIILGTVLFTGIYGTVAHFQKKRKKLKQRI